MLISGIQLSKGVERNQSFYFMSISSFVGFLGTAIVVIAFSLIRVMMASWLFLQKQELRNSDHHERAPSLSISIGQLCEAS
jgi:hypothetical protein